MGQACSSEDKELIGSVNVADQDQVVQEKVDKEAEENLAREEEKALALEKEKKLQEDMRKSEEEAKLRREEEAEQATLLAKKAEEEEVARQEAEKKATEEKEKEEKRIADAKQKADKEAEEKAKAEKKREELKKKDSETLKKFLEKEHFSNVNFKKQTSAFPSKKFHYPLHLAVKLNDSELIRILLENKADPKLENSSKKTALAKAEQKNVNGSHEKVITFLKARAGAQGAAA